jgi:1-acyl-sn-glycerol-3-phosphate acyltransferase
VGKLPAAPAAGGGASRAALVLYRVCRAAVVGICRTYWRATYEGLEHVPAEGAYVLAPVHRSFIDFGLVAGLSTRRIRYMGKDSLWKVGWFGRFITALGAFPVHRGSADREALRRCIDVIGGGEPLVLFPEGTRRTGPVVQELYEGASYIAVRTGVPIVPVGIGGSERALPKGKRLPRPVKVHVIVGPPLAPPPPRAGGRPSRRAVRELTGRLHPELQRLFDEARRAAGDN